MSILNMFNLLAFEHMEYSYITVIISSHTNSIICIISGCFYSFTPLWPIFLPFVVLFSFSECLIIIFIGCWTLYNLPVGY